MTDHPTLEPTAVVRVRAGDSSGAAPAAAFVDVVCADHELLRAEFDAIIAANFPDVTERGQRLQPATAVTTATRPMSPRRPPVGPIGHAVRDCACVAHILRARQRGPPANPCALATPGPGPTGHRGRVTNRRCWHRSTRHSRARTRPVRYRHWTRNPDRCALPT